MDDSSSSSEGGFWSHLASIFRQKNGTSLEDSIREALQEGEIQLDDVTMLLNVLRLESRSVQEIMVPRTDIICSDVEEGSAKVVELITTHGHSRIPIYKADKDTIVGVVHAKDLLSVSGEPPDLESVLRPPLFIPENKNMRDMLTVFRKKRIHLAIAVDEYGGTSGLVTLEDVLEEIVGDIQDEHDLARPNEIQSVNEHDYLVSGRLDLKELNDYFELHLDSEQVETIGGFLCELSGRVPKEGDFFTLDGLRFTVTDADNKQIRWISIQPAAETE